MMKSFKTSPIVSVPFSVAPSVFLTTSLVFLVSLPAQAGQLEQLQKQLSDQRAGWQAGESAVTRMNPGEWAGLLGLDPDQAPDVQFDNQSSAAATSSSSFSPEMTGLRTDMDASIAAAHGLDWRNYQGSNWVSPILNQGQCGSCVAFASVGTMETQYRIESGYAGFNIELSPQYLFSCGGAHCDWGWEPEKAAKFLKDYGATDNSCMTYQASRGQDVACRTACGDAASRRLRINDFTQPTDSEHDIEKIKAALAGGPLVTTMNIYQDFMYYSRGIYKHVSGRRLGSHSISIVGYDDIERALIMRNSWGPSWGEMGFARISYDDVSGLGDSTWSYRVQPFKGISLNQPADGSYAVKSLTVDAHVTVAGAKTLHTEIYDARNQLVHSQDLVSHGLVDVASLGDGRFEILVQAIDAHGAVLATSQRRYFFINGTPAAALADHSGSVMKPLSTDHRVLQLSVAPLLASEVVAPASSNDEKLNAQTLRLRVSSNVGDKEITEVAFHYRKLDGKEVVHRSKHLKDGAVLNWKTDALTKGRYEYWLSGALVGADLHLEAESPHAFRMVQ